MIRDAERKVRTLQPKEKSAPFEENAKGAAPAVCGMESLFRGRVPAEAERNCRLIELALDRIDAAALVEAKDLVG